MNLNDNEDFLSTTDATHTQGDELSFDDILQKIGFGKYQWKLIILTCLIDICDGGEIMMISMI